MAVYAGTRYRGGKPPRLLPVRGIYKRAGPLIDLALSRAITGTSKRRVRAQLVAAHPAPTPLAIYALDGEAARLVWYRPPGSSRGRWVT